MTKRIFAIGLELPDDDLEIIDFNSDQTLLDADIVLFQPELGMARFEHGEQFRGRSILDHRSSSYTNGSLKHWRSEIMAAVKAGKLVIAYLTKPREYWRYTGDQTHSGTGRNRVTTQQVVPISSYDALPFLDATPKTGSDVRLERAGRYLAPYWHEFEGPYQVELELPEKFCAVLRTKVGNRVVGIALRLESGGALIYLPPLNYDQEEFVREDDDGDLEWTDAARSFGKRLAGAVVALANTLNSSIEVTPPPNWTQVADHRMAMESTLEGLIAERTDTIRELEGEKADLETQLKQAGSLRRLLYEQGKPLERAILEAMRHFGYEAKSYLSGESEFDGLFLSAEGRLLGEAEGRDNKSIHIEKFSQLERNLQEDFQREEVTEYAKGILFGNAYRLAPICERTDFFTEKCILAAKRIGAALVRTPDMFRPARYMLEHPNDTEYAKKCRKAIQDASGDIVEFPEPPIGEADQIDEDKQN